MSRELPPQPSLEFLKKQAKELLAAERPRRPGWRLADAQHVLARDYGFDSWPKLKSYIEALPSVATGTMPNPLAGLWRANVPASRRHPLNQFRSATLAVDVAGETVTLSHVAVEESGREDRATNTLHADGVERAYDYGYVLTARWAGSHHLEVRASQGGHDMVRAEYEVSADGLTMVVTTAEQRIVFDRA